MFLNNLINLIPFFAPDTGGIAPPAELGRNDIINLLGDDEEKEETIDLKPPKEVVKEEVKEEKEDEGEVEEKEEIEEEEEKPKEVKLEDDEEDEDETKVEDLELVTPVRRKEILAKYPNLFKDFPYLNNAYYREQAYTDIFPDPDDAKVAHEKAQALDAFEADLEKGSIQKVLETVKKDNVNSFYSIVDNFLDQLAAVDDKAHMHVVGNMIKSAVKSMALEGKKTGNEDLKKAAATLNLFVFGTTDYTEPTKLSKETTKDEARESEVEKERKAFIKERFEHAQTTLNSRVDKVLRATVEGNIDPKGTMTPFVRKHAVKEVIDTVITQIARDKRFVSTSDKLWEQALKSKFDDASMNKIKDNFLSKAKTLLPDAIKKARIEATKGLSSKSKVREVDTDEAEETDDVEESRTRPPRNRTQQPRTSDKKEGKPEGMSTRDYLLKD